MRMQALVALQKFSYAGKTRRPGDLFQATPKDARILIVLKRAQEDPAGKGKEAPAGRTETPTVALVAEAMGMPPERPRRAYTRRRAAASAE